MRDCTEVKATMYSMKRSSMLWVLAAAMIAGAAGGAAAQDPQPTPQEAAAKQDATTLGFFRNTEIGGLVDGYYDYYSTKKNGIFRNFDVNHNTFTGNMAELWIAKTPAADSRLGYKVKLNFGPAASNLIAFNEPGGPLVNVQEAYGSYLAPAGKGLQIDFGKFVTPAGAEVIEAKDNWNYSRSLLFALAIPYYHAGLRLTYAPNDKVSVMGGVVNGWNNATSDNNSGKTGMFSLTLKPSGSFTFIENYIVGPEQTGTNDNVRNLSDTVATYTVNPKLSVMGNYDWAKEGSAQWQGIAAYLKYQANKWVAVVPRYEFFNDRDGLTTGTAQNLQDFTFTFEVKGADNFIWRIEYRGDFSDKAVFTKDSGATEKNQHSIAFGFLYSFSTKS
jgi:Putative beta-barrel porin-2, OmpL-like. bbp2